MFISSSLPIPSSCRLGANASVAEDRSLMSVPEISKEMRFNLSGSTVRSLTRVSSILRRVSGLSAIGVRSDTRWPATSISANCIRPCSGDKSAINRSPHCSCNRSRSNKCAKGDKSLNFGFESSSTETREKFSRPFSPVTFCEPQSNRVSSPAVT